MICFLLMNKKTFPLGFPIAAMSTILFIILLSLYSAALRVLESLLKIIVQTSQLRDPSD